MSYIPASPIVLTPFLFEHYLSKMTLQLWQSAVQAEIDRAENEYLESGIQELQDQPQEDEEYEELMQAIEAQRMYENRLANLRAPWLPDSALFSAADEDLDDCDTTEVVSSEDEEDEVDFSAIDFTEEINLSEMYD